MHIRREIRPNLGSFYIYYIDYIDIGYCEPLFPIQWLFSWNYTLEILSL